MVCVVCLCLTFPVLSTSRFTDAYEGSIESSLPFAMNSEFSGVLAKEMVSATINP